MNDRDLIANAIAEGAFSPITVGQADAMAQHVIAAIGDRLIPELPEDMTADIYVELDVVGGRGSTVAEAVRDAIEQRETYKRLEKAGAL